MCVCAEDVSWSSPDHEAKCTWELILAAKLTYYWTFGLTHESLNTPRASDLIFGWGRAFPNRALTVFVRGDRGQPSSINLWDAISVQCISHMEEEEGCPVIDYWPAGSGLHPHHVVLASYWPLHHRWRSPPAVQSETRGHTHREHTHTHTHTHIPAAA